MRGVVHLSVQLDSQNVAGVAVVADLCPLLEVVDVHALWRGGAHHDDQTAGEQTLHDVDIWSLCWGTAWSRHTGGDDCAFNVDFTFTTKLSSRQIQPRSSLSFEARGNICHTV